MSYYKERHQDEKDGLKKKEIKQRKGQEDD